MNKTISIIRIAILLALGMFAMVFLFGQEQDDSAWTLFQILIDKALALAAFWYMVRLYKRWSKIDLWLMAYNKMCDEVMETPNPAYIGKDNKE